LFETERSAISGEALYNSNGYPCFLTYFFFVLQRESRFVKKGEREKLCFIAFVYLKNFFKRTFYMKGILFSKDSKKVTLFIRRELTRSKEKK